MNTPYLDAHLHLQDPRLAVDLDGTLQRAQAAGVGAMLCNGTRERDWQRVWAIAGQYRQVIPYLGVHPWQAHDLAAGWEERLAHAAAAGWCGIGEIGLDRHCRATGLQQEEAFLRQMEVAMRLRRPVAIHCVGRWGRLVELIGRFSTEHGVLLHSFGGSLEIMRQLERLGCFFSFSCRLAEENRTRLRQVFHAVPRDRLLLETDAPDQYSAALGKIAVDGITRAVNEPAMVVPLYSVAAKELTLELPELRRRIWHNGQIFTGQAVAGR